jgi:predicted nucleotidyltransferase
VTESPLQPALDAAIDALEGLGLRYAVVGGLAVGAWGVPRATKDVDLYAELVAAVRPRLFRELLQRDFDVPAMDEELERFGVFRSLFRPTSVFVDIFDAQNPLGEAILKRRREVQVQGRIRWTAAAEDLAVLKAFSDRARDHEDLMKLIAVGGRKLDMTYIENWARELDRSIGGDEVTERLKRARHEAARRVSASTRRRDDDS